MIVNHIKLDKKMRAKLKFRGSLTKFIFVERKIDRVSLYCTLKETEHSYFKNGQWAEVF